MPDYREIPLSQGKVTIVDAEHYPYLSQWGWYATFRRNLDNCSAYRHLPKGERASLHREVVLQEFQKLYPGKFVRFGAVIHRNGDKLDNRFCNLQVMRLEVDPLPEEGKKTILVRCNWAEVNRLKGQRLRAAFRAREALDIANSLSKSSMLDFEKNLKELTVQLEGILEVLQPK